MKKLWGGAFTETSAELVDRFGQSIRHDLNFWQEDVIGSVAHARMLGETGIISKEESQKIMDGLEEIHDEGPQGLNLDVEDIHTAIEARLYVKIGDLAGKLNTARSRNDQVATSTRLYLHNHLLVVLDQIKELQSELLVQATRHQAALMPGFTHHQHAQPITLGFHLLAHFWALQRHGYRAERLFELANYSPLGAGALAGTSFPIDREMTSNELGFTAPIPNALDAVSDRSFILDALHVCSLIMTDLSRMSQELILWSTREYGFLKLHDSVTTGSAILPQKRNPDMAELIRGRTGKTLANYVTVASIMKGLPLGYNRDTQDDKPRLFDSLRKAEDSLKLTKLMLESAEWNLTRLSQATEGDFSTAADLAEFLAAQGIPFREAHELVGNLVLECHKLGLTLEQLDANLLNEINSSIPQEALAVLSPQSSVKRRESMGGPGPKAMKFQLDHAAGIFADRGFGRIA
jgi:argininosuccinate lyase